MKGLVALTFVLMGIAFAQVQTGGLGGESKTIEENGYYSVQRLELAGATRALLPPRPTDTIVVALGTGIGIEPGKAASLDDGDVRFLPRSKEASIVHGDEPPAQAVLIDLKKHWEDEIQPCHGPQCNHAIRVGGMEIGQSTSLFTNGFVTAYRDRMDAGGTLSTSYYSKSGTHHLMVIALDDLHANFDGAGKELKRGQVFGTDANEVEVDAGAHAVRWIVIRIETPKQ